MTMAGEELESRPPRPERPQQQEQWRGAAPPRRRRTDAVEGRSAEQLDRAITGVLAQLAERRTEADERRRHLAFAPDADLSPIPAPLPARILVVDDEAVICRLMTTALTMAGYAVEGETSGAAALERLTAAAEGRAEPIDLVVTDTRMPGMSGWELVRRIRDRWPATPVLRISGFADAAGADTAGLDPTTVPFLPKPFLPEELVRHVTLVLGR